MGGGLRGAQLQFAELRNWRGSPQVVSEPLVEPGGSAQHSARCCEQEILRMQMKPLGEIAHQFGESRGTIVNQRTRRRIACFRRPKHNGKQEWEDFVWCGVDAGLQIRPSWRANFGKD